MTTASDVPSVNTVPTITAQEASSFAIGILRKVSSANGRNNGDTRPLYRHCLRKIAIRFPWPETRDSLCSNHLPSVDMRVSQPCSFTHSASTGWASVGDSDATHLVYRMEVNGRPPV